MSWREFMETRCFGPGIMRPYADYLSDLSSHIDGLLALDPSFGHFVLPLVRRDLFFVHGQRVALLCLSAGAFRHYPFRAYVRWEKFFNVSENEFLSTHGGLETVPSVVDSNDIYEAVTKDYNFDSPVCVGLPALFSVRKDSPEGEIKSTGLRTAAQLIVGSDRARYETYMEMQKPKDIFLSHRGVDKAIVRECAATLRAVGLTPWLDEDRMKAGAHLERALLQGFHDSCAAVFFVTPSFKDDGYLATEVDYAVAEKRLKGDRFAIVTLLIPGEDGSFGEVPHLLRTYVWKQVLPIGAIRTILEALPISCGAPSWRV